MVVRCTSVMRTLLGRPLLEQTDNLVLRIIPTSSDTGACFLETGLNGNPLVDGGEELEINGENVVQFVEEATNFWFRAGVEKQIRAFREGFNDILPIQTLYCLSPRELMNMICGEDRIDWDKVAVVSVVVRVRLVSLSHTSTTWAVRYSIHYGNG